MEGKRLKSIVVAGREVLDHVLDAIQPTDDVVVAFNDRASIVSGIVHDTQGLPLHDVFVTIFGADRSSWFPGSRRVADVRTDARGRYTITNLPPGDYLAAVSLDLDSGEWFDPTCCRHCCRTHFHSRSPASKPKRSISFSGSVRSSLLAPRN